MLTEDELKRYDRQLIIRGIGEAGQERLKRGRVVIGGAGGLGTAAALSLAAAGVGRIRIIDCEEIEISHLNRQVLYWTKDVGRGKLDCLCERLRQLNDQVQIEGIADPINETNAAQLTSGFDVLLDGTDNVATRFLLNSAALRNGLPFVHGAVFGFEGRVTTIIPGRTPCLSCIYRGQVSQQRAPIIGVASAVVGALQATEAIKYMLGIGHLLANQLLVYNGFKMRFTTLAIKRDPSCRECGNMKTTVSAGESASGDTLPLRV